MAASLVTGVVVGACTSSSDSSPPPDSRPSAAQSADEFMAAFNSGDFEDVSAALDTTVVQWSARKLRRWTHRRLPPGLVTAVEMERSGEPEETPGTADSVEVPYTITIESTATTEPASLSGAFQMSFDPDSDNWLAVWNESVLWPGIEGARRLDVVAKWPRRAPLLDRKGRRIAVGVPASSSSNASSSPDPPTRSPGR